jgi:hypothetical protein
MPLIDLKTSLKSLKFGKDRPYEGSSNQPYIQSSIPEGDIPTSGGTDFLLRGGILAPIRAAKDVSRLTQMFFDLKSPNGLQFITKQNILSRTSVQTQASSNGGVAYAAGAVNQGVYLPSSTLAQAGVGFTGTHLNLLGIDPSSPMSGITNAKNSLNPTTVFDESVNETITLGLKRYEDVVKENAGFYVPSKNRLYELSTKNGLILSQTPQSQDDKKDPKNFFQKVGNYLNNYTIDSPGKGILIKYSGGPGSVLGVGQTIIRFADRSTKNTLENLKDEGFSTKGYSIFGSKTTVTLSNPTRNTPQSNINYINTVPSGSAKGVSSKYESLTGNPVDNGIEYTSPLAPSGQRTTTNNFSVYKRDTFQLTPLQTVNGSLTFTQDQLKNSKPQNTTLSKIKPDFRSILISGSISGNNGEDIAVKDIRAKKSSIISLAPNYLTKNIEDRLNLGNPGKKDKNVYNYTAASSNDPTINYKLALDKITAGGIYTAGTAIHNPDNGKYAGNDLVKFSIGVIQNNSTNSSSFMHFRAFIDSFSDSYNSNWGSYNYVGRGDKFYNYEGFERTINLSFTVFAQSKAELIPMYKKLNYLASSLAPDYSDSGFMKGNLHKLTIGGYLFDQVGIIKSITYDIPEETPWEIGINDQPGAGDDTSVKELPHMIKVTNITFVPIQHFLPRVANPDNQKDTRYIALAANTNNEYTNYTP